MFYRKFKPNNDKQLHGYVSDHFVVLEQTHVLLTSLMTEATRIIENSLSVESIRKGALWIVFQKRYTKVIATLGRE